jgi:drug/metabolite transporter (DMT)-like permease
MLWWAAASPRNAPAKMGALLALLSALVYGGADFCGGKASRQAHAATVTFGGQLAGMLVLLPALLFVPGNGPTARAFAWGGAGGFAGAVGLMFLYNALSAGNMSVVSPISAVIAAVIPIVVGVAFLSERPSLTAVVGIICAVVAIVLVTMSPSDSVRVAYVRTILTAMVAGAGFGFYFVCLQRAGSPKVVGLWAAFAARPVSIAVTAVVAVRQKVPLIAPRAALPLAVVGGMLDQTANVLYVLSIGRGLLSVLAVLASLYPVSTVVLARVVDHEKLVRTQLAGLALAFCALVLIAV